MSSIAKNGINAQTHTLAHRQAGADFSPDRCHKRRVMVATSSGIRALDHIEKFLGVDAVIAPSETRTSDQVEAVIVWGRKGTAAPALEYAKNNNLSVSFLEDGWIRSTSVSAHNRRSYSLLVDKIGVYYDATQPSEIERCLNQSNDEFYKDCSSDELAYAESCRRMLVDLNITKYNYCKIAQLPSAEKDFVLVIDQTLDDASVQLGAMDAERFKDMLDTAMKENPNASVIVRTHPDVVAGRRKGYLSEVAESYGIALSADGDNPMPWLKQALRVYVGTSQVGYEALLCGTEVSVFGQPFYSGWGLTDDRQPVERRKALRDINELFHVAHVRYSRYVNPITGEPWQLHECLEHVQLQKHYFKKNALHFQCAGITRWKQGYIRQYLRSPDGSVSFKSVRDIKRYESVNIDRAAHANSVTTNTNTNTTATATATATATWSFRHFVDGDAVRMEDGFLRSTGLGSDFTAPGSLVVDHAGLYFDPSSASDLENLLNFNDLTPTDIKRAVRLRKRILAAGLSKYNVGERTQKYAKSAVNKCVLVIGQVEDDASIQRGCDLITSNAGLLRAVRDAEPSAYIVYKPHPDVQAGNRRGSVEKPLEWANEVNSTSSITEGLEWCEELHTMTSLAGFEALMREKHVVTYGMPFYSGWGLTEDRCINERRARVRTLDELVYMTLIEYPRYLDIASGEFMSPETMVTRMERELLEARAPNDWLHRQITKVVNIVKGCQYAP